MWAPGSQTQRCCPTLSHGPALGQQKGTSELECSGGLSTPPDAAAHAASSGAIMLRAQCWLALSLVWRWLSASVRGVARVARF